MTRISTICLISVTLALLAFSANVASAGSAVSVKTQVPNVNVQPNNHKGWVETTGFSHGVSQPATTASGTSAGKERSTFSDFTINKQLDKASPNLWGK